MGSNTTSQGGTSANQSTANSLSVQTRDPYAAALPDIQNLVDRATFMNGSLQAGASVNGPLLQQAYNTAVNQGSGNGMTAAMDPALGQLGGIASGANSITTGNLYNQLFNQAQQPGQVQANLRGLAADPSGALTPTQQAILDQNAQRINDLQASKYSGAGRYGSFGAGIGTARGIAETNNPLMAQWNQANIGNSLAANQQISQDALARMGLSAGAAQGLSNVQQQNIGNQMNAANSQLNAYGQGQQRALAWNAQTPALYNAAMAPYQMPWEDLKNWSGVYGNLSPMLANAGTITNVGSQQTEQAGQTTGQTSTPTPWTTYAGLGVAGIGALSDRRVKTNIKKVGRDPWSGLSMYEYRYKGQPKNTPKFVGPMAQDVQKIAPEAVGELPGGILYIKKAA